MTLITSTSSREQPISHKGIQCGADVTLQLINKYFIPGATDARLDHGDETTVQQVCHCRAGGRVIRQQEHYYIVILFLLADPGDEPHFGRSVLPAPLMSSYNHQVGPARSRPPDFPRLIGGALVHGAAPLALATSSELWNLPRPYPVLS